MKKLLTILFAFGWVVSLSGQDLNLSNYRPAGMLFNPALTATSGDKVQLGIQYRRQWAAIQSLPFVTKAVTGEIRGKNTAFGIQIHQNDAGEASLETTGMMLSGAYHKPLSRHSELSLGVAFGRILKRFDPAQFTFDNQFVEGSGFVMTEPNGESFSQVNSSLTDVAVGANWSGKFSKNENLTGHLGLSFAHINRPDEGFSGFTSELPLKTVLMAGIDIRAGKMVDISPHLFYQKQGTHQETLIGLSLGGILTKKSKVQFGISHRVKDAVIGHVGLELGNKKFHFSYDANNSKLQRATNGRGAWEVGVYIGLGNAPEYEAPKVVMKCDCSVGSHVDCKNPDCPCPDVLADLDDADGDGVPDEMDRCPLERGLPVFYGCNDSDLDGTIDPDDSCPEIFGPHDNNGCPVQGRDSDRDGIPDSEDYCVYLKGIAEFHGCPDSDRDGVSDVDDECPYLKGSKSNQGCPTGAETAQGGAEAVVVVEFATDQSKIEEEFQKKLDGFIKKIPRHSEYRVIVSGHTDTEGSAYYNHSLGKSRADRVMGYLVRKGVPLMRIETISYGETIPRKSNETTFGKARNRRCEVTLILE